MEINKRFVVIALHLIYPSPDFMKLKTYFPLFLALQLMIASCGGTRPTLPASIVNQTPSRAVFSPDGQYIAAGIWGAVRIWNVQTEEYKDYETKLRNETPKCVTFSPDGKWIATGIFGAVRTWELSTGASRDYPMKVRNETPEFIAISPDGQTIATAAFGGVMKWKYEGFDKK